MNVKKHFLHKIVGLGTVSKNAPTYIPNRRRKVPEELGKRFSVAPTHSRDQRVAIAIPDDGLSTDLS